MSEREHTLSQIQDKSLPGIIFFKKETEDDPYRKQFAEAGWICTFVEVLEVDYIENQATVCLGFPEKYGGLIITSGRAVEALSVCACVVDMSEWKKKPIYVVGPATKKRVENMGFLDIRGETGDGKSLGIHIAGHPNRKPWLFLCGQNRRKELPQQLTLASIPFDECIIYRTRGVEHLTLLDIQKPDWVAFFSPSGVQAVKPAWPSDWGSVYKAAIGKTTAHAIRKHEWDVDAVAEMPTADSIFQVIVDSEN